MEKVEVCAACERVKRVCDRAEAEIQEKTKIKQAGHINTLAIRCAQAGSMDPWESATLNKYMNDISAIETAMNDDYMSNIQFRALVKDIINETGDWAPKDE